MIGQSEYPEIRNSEIMDIILSHQLLMREVSRRRGILETPLTTYLISVLVGITSSVEFVNQEIQKCENVEIPEINLRAPPFPGTYSA